MTQIVLSVKDIMKLIPHRYPFLLLDRVQEIVLNESCTGIKNVTFNEPFFQGHFPQDPIMPGVLIVEAMAQAAGVLVCHSNQISGADSGVYFMSIEEAKFRKPVTPGDVLELKVEKQKQRGPVWKFSGKAYVGETVHAEATFTAMIVNNAPQGE